MPSDSKYSRLPLLLSLELLLEIRHSSLEFINTAARIDKFLFAREERVALGANINSLLAALGGHGLNDLAASAPNDALLVIRMDSFFHVRVPRFHKFDVL